MVQLAITVRRLIAHEVPRPLQGQDAVEPQLSEAIPDLPQRTLDFFGRRLIRSFADRGQSIEVDPRLEDPRLPGILRELLAEESPDLLDPSQRAARYLLEVQPGSPYEQQSLFVMAIVVANGRRSIALMKLEREVGVHVQQRQIDGKSVLDVEVLEDLMLTDKTRVFKAGLFWLDRNVLKGYVSDDQQAVRDDPARFFLQRFLGCRLERSPSVVTRDFYRATEAFITKHVDESRKLDYFNALQVEMASNRGQIDPVQFARDYFEPDERAPFEGHLHDAGVPTAAFDKDITKLGPSVKRSRVKTSAGITISGAAQEMKDRVGVITFEGAPAIVVRDTIAEV